MDAQHAYHTASDSEIAEHMRSLDDEQLAEFLHAIDAVEIGVRANPGNLGAAALFYAERLRWPIFPCIPSGKRPLTRNGFKDATTDPETVRSWWTRWPEANIATPTGAAGCGLDVIDVDGRPGLESLSKIKHAHCPDDCTTVTFCGATGDLPPVVARAMTPGGSDGCPGWHYYIAPTGDGNTTGMDPGIDYRGAGGYVIVPPSKGGNGRRYAWLTRPASARP